MTRKKKLYIHLKKKAHIKKKGDEILEKKSKTMSRRFKKVTQVANTC